MSAGRSRIGTKSIRYALADVERYEQEHTEDARPVGMKRPTPIRRHA